ncbi:hypothetical protein KJ765_04015 [Candidatus Micrarchaeota archaeon]|nr:hypothetical protein [Candidatus Micrarchaeota archaeon]
MGLVESLKDLYFKIEDKYYAFCDYMENNVGLPVYDKFVTPIESNGVPSFPVAILLVLIMFSALAVALITLFPGNTNLRVLVQSGDQPLANIPVTLLLEGEEFATVQSDKDGFALFEGVPVGKKATLRVEQDGFETFVKTFVIGKGVQRITASLQGLESEPQSQRVTLKVVEENGIPLGGVQISYFDSASGEYKQATTDANGVAKLSAASGESSLSFTISKDGFQEYSGTILVSAQRTLTVHLQSTRTLPPDDGGRVPPKGTVAVEVTDESGEPVDAKVYLYLAESDSEMDVQRTYESGKVRFGEVDAVGAFVYVVVDPLEEQYLPYDGSADAAKLRVDDVLEFHVTLLEKEEGVNYDLVVRAMDYDDESFLENVHVTIYNQETNAKLADKKTDETGEVVFTTDRTVYATLYRDGYLAARESELSAGDDVTVTMFSAVEGNNGDLEVQVLDADSNRVEGAKVALMDGEGFFIGVPDAYSMEDGVASFYQLDVEPLYRAVASKPPVAGTSSDFTIDVGDVKRITINLERPTGFLLVYASDQTNDENITANVQAFVKRGNELVGECTTDIECLLKVPANMEIYLLVTADGYVSKESEALVVEAEGTFSVDVALLPEALANELRVDFEGVRLADSSEQLYSKNLSSLSRASFYVAKFSLNIPPGSEEGGFFARVEGLGYPAADDIAFIRNVDAPPTASITSASTYTPGGDCSVDTVAEEQYSSRAIKWVDAKFVNEIGGKSFKVKFFITPNASAQDAISLHYRGYASKGGIYFRTPEDTELEQAESIPSKDSCYAEAFVQRYDINTGNFVCTSRSCMSLQFAENDGAPRMSRSYTADLGSAFNSYFSVRALEPFQDSPWIKISVDDEVQLFEYLVESENLPPATGDAQGRNDVTIQLSHLDEGETAEGSIRMKGTIPTPYSNVEVLFGDGSGEVQRMEGSVVIQGTGVLTLRINPESLPGNQDTNLVATVTNAIDESPMVDAVLSIEEEEGMVFEGAMPPSIVGDNSPDLGENGLYRFRSVHPYGSGTFSVHASREGFRSASSIVNVEISDFMELSTSSLYVTCSGATLDITNLLNAEITVFATSNCVQLLPDSETTQTSDTSWTIRLNKQKTKALQVMPVRRGSACNLGFSATLPNGQSDQETVSVQVACNDLPTTCDSNEDCPEGETCNIDNSSCYMPGPEPCTNDAFCQAQYNDQRYMCDTESGNICRLKTCEDLSCADGQYCDSIELVCADIPQCGDTGQACCEGDRCYGYLQCDLQTNTCGNGIVCEDEVCTDTEVCCLRSSDLQMGCALSEFECAAPPVECPNCDPDLEYCVIQGGRASCVAVDPNCGHDSQTCCVFPPSLPCFNDLECRNNVCLDPLPTSCAEVECPLGLTCDPARVAQGCDDTECCVAPTICGDIGELCCPSGGELLCQDPYVCANGRCIEGEVEQTCNFPADCGSDPSKWKCENHICVQKTCDEIDACPGTQLCNTETVSCYTPQCTSNSECDALGFDGYVCREEHPRLCEPLLCQNDNDCVFDGWYCDPTSNQCVKPECSSNDLCDDSNNYCDENGVCQAKMQWPALPTVIEVHLDDQLRWEQTYSLNEDDGLGDITNCEVISSDSNSDARMQLFFLSQECDETLEEGKVIRLSADYSDHPFYTEEPVIPEDEGGGYDPYCTNYDPQNPACANQYGYGNPYGGGGNYNPQCPVYDSYNPACRQGNVYRGDYSALSFSNYESLSNEDVLTFSSSDDTLIHTGRLYIRKRVRPSLTRVVKVYGPARAWDDYDLSATILITSTGFRPQNKNVIIGGEVTWINLDNTDRSVVSRQNGLFNSGNIQPGKSFTHSFNEPGVFLYSDGTRSGVTGSITVGHEAGLCRYRNPRYFAKRFAQHLARPLLGYFDYPGRGQDIAASSAYKFYINRDGSVTTGQIPGLGFPQSSFPGQNPWNQQYNPFGQPAQQYFNQNPAGNSFGQFAPDPGLCTPSGSTYNCKIPINPLLPVNGVAFTIINDFALMTGSPSQLQVSGGSKTECLRGVYVDRSGASGVLVGLVQELSEFIGIAPRYSTFILLLKPECVDYYVEGNELKLKFKGDGERLHQELQMAMVGLTVSPFTMNLDFEIDNDVSAAKYALQVVPASSEVFVRLFDEDPGAKEPVFVVNNIPKSIVRIDSQEAKNLKPDSGKNKVLYLPGIAGSNVPYQFESKMGKTGDIAQGTIRVPPNNLPDPRASFDVIGNAPKGSGTTCWENNFCSVEDFSSVNSRVRSDILDSMKVQEIDFNTFGDATAEAIARALVATLADYVTDQAQFRSCGGTRAILDVCNSRGSNPYENDWCYEGEHCDDSIDGNEIWSVFANEFEAGLCDTQIYNQLDGLLQTRNYGLLHQLIFQKLSSIVGMGPTRMNTKPIVDLRDYKISVLYKRAADGTDSQGFVLMDYPLISPGSSQDKAGFMSLEQWVQSSNRDETEEEITNPWSHEDVTYIPDSSNTVTDDGMRAIRKEGSREAPWYPFLYNENDDISIRFTDGLSLATVNKYPINKEKDELGLLTSDIPHIPASENDGRAVKLVSCYMDFEDKGDGGVVAKTSTRDKSCPADVVSKWDDLTKVDELCREDVCTDGEFDYSLSTTIRIDRDRKTMYAIAAGKVIGGTDYSTQSLADLKMLFKYIMDETNASVKNIFGEKTPPGDQKVETPEAPGGPPEALLAPPESPPVPSTPPAPEEPPSQQEPPQSTPTFHDFPQSAPAITGVIKNIWVMDPEKIIEGGKDKFKVKCENGALKSDDPAVKKPDGVLEVPKDNRMCITVDLDTTKMNELFRQLRSTTPGMGPVVNTYVYAFAFEQSKLSVTQSDVLTSSANKLKPGRKVETGKDPFGRFFIDYSQISSKFGANGKKLYIAVRGWDAQGNSVGFGRFWYDINKQGQAVQRTPFRGVIKLKPGS